jgi:hypothetical protein
MEDFYITLESGASIDRFFPENQFQVLKINFVNQLGLKKTMKYV